MATGMEGGSMNYAEKVVARQIKSYHKKTYVNFKQEATISKLTKDELENMLDWLIANNYKFIKHTTKRELITKNSYSLTYNDRLIMLSAYDGSNYYWYSTDYHDDAKNNNTPNSFITFRKMFRNRTGVKMLDAFGKTPQSFKVLCPKPLYYINYSYTLFKWYDGVSKEDYTSHYPWAALGKLPNANTAIEVEGKVDPNYEYQFAFYPDSGHVAVYNEFDSHDWKDFIKTYSAKVKVNKYVAYYDRKDTKTILMKASEHSLYDEIMHFYNIKCNSIKDSTDYYNAKIFLLKFIGMLEQCSHKIYCSYPYAHLASVIKWRANIKMFRTIQDIQPKNVIQVCVDGIIHQGEVIGSTQNTIGILKSEITNGRFIHRGINQYILKTSKNEERKHSGFDINTDTDITSWLASPKVDFLTYIKTNYMIEEKL